MLRPYSSWLDSRGAGDRCRRAPVPAIGTACYTRPFVPRCLRAAAAPLLSAIAPAGAPAARGRRIANRATTAVPGPRRRHVFDAEERGSPAQCRAGQRRLWRLLPDLRTTTPIAVGTFGAPSHALYSAVAGGEVPHIGICPSRRGYAQPGRVGTVRAGGLARGTVLALAIVALVVSPIRNANRECPVSHEARAGRWWPPAWTACTPRPAPSS